MPLCREQRGGIHTDLAAALDVAEGELSAQKPLALKWLRRDCFGVLLANMKWVQYHLDPGAGTLVDICVLDAIPPGDLVVMSAAPLLVEMAPPSARLWDTAPPPDGASGDPSAGAAGAEFDGGERAAIYAMALSDHHVLLVRDRHDVCHTRADRKEFGAKEPGVTGTIIDKVNVRHPVRGMSFSSDGRLLGVETRDGAVFVYPLIRRADGVLRMGKSPVAQRPSRRSLNSLRFSVSSPRRLVGIGGGRSAKERVAVQMAVHGGSGGAAAEGEAGRAAEPAVKPAEARATAAAVASAVEDPIRVVVSEVQDKGMAEVGTHHLPAATAQFELRTCMGWADALETRTTKPESVSDEPKLGNIENDEVEFTGDADRGWWRRRYIVIEREGGEQFGYVPDQSPPSTYLCMYAEVQVQSGQHDYGSSAVGDMAPLYRVPVRDCVLSTAAADTVLCISRTRAALAAPLTMLRFHSATECAEWKQRLSDELGDDPGQSLDSGADDELSTAICACGLGDELILAAQAWSPLEDTVIMACTNGTLLMFDCLQVQWRATRMPRPDRVVSISWHPDGAVALLVLEDGDVHGVDRALNALPITSRAPTPACAEAAHGTASPGSAAVESSTLQYPPHLCSWVDTRGRLRWKVSCPGSMPSTSRSGDRVRPDQEPTGVLAASEVSSGDAEASSSFGYATKRELASVLAQAELSRIGHWAGVDAASRFATPSAPLVVQWLQPNHLHVHTGAHPTLASLSTHSGAARAPKTQRKKGKAEHDPSSLAALQAASASRDFVGAAKSAAQAAIVFEDGACCVFSVTLGAGRGSMGAPQLVSQHLACGRIGAALEVMWSSNHLNDVYSCACLVINYLMRAVGVSERSLSRRGHRVPGRPGLDALAALARAFEGLVARAMQRRYARRRHALLALLRRYVGLLLRRNEFESALRAAYAIRAPSALFEVSAWAMRADSPDVAAGAALLARSLQKEQGRSKDRGHGQAASGFDYDALARALRTWEGTARAWSGDDAGAELARGISLECAGRVREAERLYISSGMDEHAERLKVTRQALSQVRLPLEMPRDVDGDSDDD